MSTPISSPFQGDPAGGLRFNLSPTIHMGNNADTLDLLQNGTPGLVPFPDMDHTFKALQAPATWDAFSLSPTSIFTNDSVVGTNSTFQVAPSLAPESIPVEPQTPEAFEVPANHIAYSTQGDNRPEFMINRQDPTLLEIATARLQSGTRYMCVSNVAMNLETLGVPHWAPTGADPNNTRGALVQALNGGFWTSLPVGQETTINSSAFGSATGYIMTPAQYQELRRNDQIPSGALLISTRGQNGLLNSNILPGADNASSGRDVAIIRDRGNATYGWRGGVAQEDLPYGDSTTQIVVLVPRSSLQTVPPAETTVVAEEPIEPTLDEDEISTTVIPGEPEPPGGANPNTGVPASSSGTLAH
ncbi:MAG: hypothetical protein SFZ03_06615 [Candidatus Melainabacteria bacterium]|nr:hypothetical protein [Candidatus Melainabacteria bacterium]